MFLFFFLSVSENNGCKISFEGYFLDISSVFLIGSEAGRAERIRRQVKDKETDVIDLGHSVHYSILAHVSAEKEIRSVYVKLLIIALARERERAREAEYLRT